MLDLHQRRIRIAGTSLGVFSIANTSEFPSAAAVCSLSAVLETQVASKYYLSPRACAGILRRAGKRGKELPMTLHLALEQVAGDSSVQGKPGDKTA